MNRDLLNLSRENKGSILAPITVNYIIAKDHNRAGQLVESIESPSDKVYVLSVVKEAYAKTGNNLKAIDILAQSTETAIKVSDARERAGILVDIARSYIKLGERERGADVIAQAVEDIAKIGYDDEKVRTLRTIFDSFTQPKFESFGKPTEEAKYKAILARAAQIVGNIDDFQSKVSALDNIAVTYAKINTENNTSDAAALAIALGLTRRINTPPGEQYRAVALDEIVNAYVGSVKVSKALDTLTNAVNVPGIIDMNPVFASSHIAVAYSKVGDVLKARRILAEAVKETENVPDLLDRIYSYDDIAMAYLEIGDAPISHEILTKSIGLEVRLDNLRDRVYAFCDIATIYHRMGDNSKAHEDMARAIETAEEIGNQTLTRVNVFARIAEAYHHIGDDSKALDNLAKAMETAGNISEIADKSLAWNEIENVHRIILAETNDAATIVRAAEIATNINNAQFKNTALSNAVMAYVKVLQERKDTSAFTRVIKIVEHIDDVQVKNTVLPTVFNLYMDTIKETKDPSAIGYALEMVEKLDNTHYNKPSMLINIANRYIKLGEIPKARGSLTRAIEIMPKIRAAPDFMLLGDIAEVHAKLGNWRRARQIAVNSGLDNIAQAAILSRILMVWAIRDDPALSHIEPKQLLFPQR